IDGRIGPCLNLAVERVRAGQDGIEQCGRRESTGGDSGGGVARGKVTEVHLRGCPRHGNRGSSSSGNSAALTAAMASAFSASAFSSAANRSGPQVAPARSRSQASASSFETGGWTRGTGIGG